MKKINLLFSILLTLSGLAAGQTSPKPTPTPDILKGGAVTDATDRMVKDSFGGKGQYDGIFAGEPNSSGGTIPVKTPADWKRTVLTGTGLSVASPIPFKLRRSEPLASLVGNMEADVLWELEYGDLRAYVGYQKEDKGYKAVRQPLEDIIQYMLNNAKAVESLVHDTTFLGETAAFYDEVQYEPSKNKSVRQKRLVYGRPNDYVTIHHIFPADDTAAATLSSQIIASLKKEGSLAVGKSKFPPLEWKLYNFGGLLFEFPAKPAESNCKDAVRPGESQTCADWGKLVDVSVIHRIYPPGKPQMTVMQHAEAYVKSWKETEASAKAEYRFAFSIAAFPINIGEAAVVLQNTGFDHTQTIFIRRGNAVWEVSIDYSISFEQAKLVGERAFRSVKFKN